jgi:hypothetical protein
MRLIYKILFIILFAVYFFTHAQGQTLTGSLKPDSVMMLNLKGDKGDKGEQGEQGIQGLPGKDGVSTGFTFPPLWSIRFCSTFDEFETALLLSQTGQVRSIYIVSQLTQTRKIRLTNTPANPAHSVLIEGGKNDIIIMPTVDTAIVLFHPSLASANNAIDFQLDWRNTTFRAQNNQTVIASITGSYGSSFDDCKFFGGKVQLDIRFALQTSVTDCQFNNPSYVALNLTFDKYADGSGSNSLSQPNHPYIVNNKFRSLPGAFSNIKLLGVSGAYIFHNIHEGGDRNHISAQYAIHFDDAGSTVVKDGYIGMNHFEAIFTAAAIYIKGKDGGWQVENSFSQYPCILIDYSTTAYGHIYINQIPFLKNGTTFKSTGQARWHWSAVKFDPMVSTLWSGGVVPDKQEVYGIDPNGQTPYINLSGRKVQTITTQ